MPHIAQGIKKINLRVNEHGDITHKSLAQKGKGKGKKMVCSVAPPPIGTVLCCLLGLIGTVLPTRAYWSCVACSGLLEMVRIELRALEMLVKELRNRLILPLDHGSGNDVSTAFPPPPEGESKDRCERWYM